MATHRIDLGPNCWIAAAGEALLHVKVRRGWSVTISLEPVRDIRVSRAKFFEGYWEYIPVLFLLLWGGCGFTRHVYTREVNPFLGALFLVTLLGMITFGIAFAYRRMGRLTLRLGRGSDSRLNCLDMPNKIADQPEMATFLDHLTALSSAAPDKRRERCSYSLNAWWGTVTAVLLAIAAIVALILWFIDGAQPVHAVLVALIFVGGLFLVSSERGLLVHRPLRRAQTLLLYGDLDSAVEILKEFLNHHPTHARANYLMTVAELLRGNMQLAEELIIQYATPGIRHTLFTSRFEEYRLWESRHGDN